MCVCANMTTCAYSLIPERNRKKKPSSKTDGNALITEYFARAS